MENKEKNNKENIVDKNDVKSTKAKSTKTATAKKATAKKATAKPATAKKATAKPATAKKATAKPATAKKETVKAATAKDESIESKKISNDKEAELKEIKKAEQKELNRVQKEVFVVEKEKMKEKFSNYKDSVKNQRIDVKSQMNDEINSLKEELSSEKEKLSSIKGSLSSADSTEKIEKEIEAKQEDIKSKKKDISDKKKELRARMRKGYYPIDKNVAIELKSAYKYYVSNNSITKVIDDLSLKIFRDEVTVILGPSGSGKTTLLNLISGLDKPSAGDVITNNYNLSWIRERRLINFRKENISFIFQQYNLIPTLNIEDNIRTGYEIKNPDIEPIDIEELMKRINIWDSRKKYPYQLSGGQLQRTAIARALAKNPDIIFADEPTGALDENMSKEVLDMLINITKQYNKTLIIVTHNPQIAKIGNRILRFGDGKIVKDQRNKTPEKPKNLNW